MSRAWGWGAVCQGTPHAAQWESLVEHNTQMFSFLPASSGSMPFWFKVHLP